MTTVELTLLDGTKHPVDISTIAIYREGTTRAENGCTLMMVGGLPDLEIKENFDQVRSELRKLNW